MTLYGRLAVMMVVLALGMGIVVGFGVGAIVQRELRAESELRGRDLAEQVAAEITADVTAGNRAAVRAELEHRTAATRDLVFAWVVDADEEVLAHTFTHGLPEGLAESSHRGLPRSEHYQHRPDSELGPVLIIGQPLGESGAHLHLGLSEASAFARAAQVRRQIILIALLVAGLAAALMILMARRMTLPIGHLAEAMRAFGRGESSEVSLPGGGGLEVSRLVDAFNTMTSARRQAEAELRQSEERFSQVFTESPVGIMVFDEGGRLVEANPASLRILGFESAEEIGTAGMSELFHLLDDQRERVLGGELLRCEVAIAPDADPSGPLRHSRRRDGFAMQVSIRPLRREADGRPTSYLAQLQDVTAEVRVLEDLRQARERAEHYLDVAGVVLLALDRDGTVTLINRWGCDILGYPEEQIVGRNWFAHFLPERLRDQVRQFHREVLSGRQGEMVGGENPVLCADGSERLIAWRNSLLRDAGGKVVATLSSGEDVTERRRAEEELRQSERRFRTLVESMGDGLIILDTAGQISYVNPATREMLGYEQSDGLSTQVTDYLDAENEALFLEQWRGQSSRRSAGSYQLRITAASGRQVPVLVTATALRDADGELSGSLAVLKDITEHAEAVQALRDSEERYRALADSLPQIIFEADVQGRLTFSNRHARERLGYELAQVAGPASALEMIAPDDRQRALEHIRGLLEGEEVGPVEYQIITGDGQVFPAVLHAGAIRRGETVVGIRGVIFDISDVKRAEAEISELNQFRQNVIDSADVWLSVADAEARVLVWNRAAERISGYRRDEVVGDSQVWEWLMPEQSARRTMFELAQRALEGEQLEQVESRLRRRDGEERVVEWSARPMSSPEGDAPAVVVLGRDITESRRLSRQLERAQRMDAVGRLAGGIAHDFNNLLSAIMGHLGMLLRALPSEVAERRHAEQIDAAVRQASTMTRQLLAFSRREPVTTELQPIDLNQVIEGLRGLVQPLLARDIQLSVQLAPELPPVRADAGELQQMLMNLIINARDAMPQGGSLAISTRVVPLEHSVLRSGPEGAEDCVLITVADTGQGMDEETRAHIFEPFFTTKPDGEGTGLGLSTVYRVVQNLGGAIEVRSKVGEGTSFEIYLPGSERAEQGGQAEPVISDEALRGSETVLVAEDEDVLRDLCRVMLEEFGYRPLVAADGESALQLAEQHRDEIDLLVTDILMPGMSGVQLAQRVQEFLPELPVLYISGYAGAIVAQGQRFDPGDALVQKPFTLDDLLLAMRRSLDG